MATTEPVVDKNPLLGAVRSALRIKSIKLDDEIINLIDSCLTDLSMCGIETSETDDPLILRAVIFYCKGNFGYDQNPQSIQAYESLKAMMALASKYK